MNTQAGLPESFAPPPLRKLGDTGLTVVMMRDIMLKTVFRKNVEHASDIAAAICLPTPAHAGADRHVARDGADAGHRHAACDLVQRDGLPADRCGQGARARRPVAVGILWRDARAAGGLQGSGQAPVDQERADHARSSGGLDGQPDPARGHDRPAWAGGHLRPFGADVRPSGQRQVVDRRRHPGGHGRSHLHPPRAELCGPGDHHVRPDRSYQGGRHRSPPARSAR